MAVIKVAPLFFNAPQSEIDETIKERDQAIKEVYKANKEEYDLLQNQK